MRWIRKKIMHHIIDTAVSAELNDIVHAVLRRYDKIFEDEEVVFLSMPKRDKEERLRILGAILAMEEQSK